MKLRDDRVTRLEPGNEDNTFFPGKPGSLRQMQVGFQHLGVVAEIAEILRPVVMRDIGAMWGERGGRWARGRRTFLVPAPVLGASFAGDGRDVLLHVDQVERRILVAATMVSMLLPMKASGCWLGLVERRLVRVFVVPVSRGFTGEESRLEPANGPGSPVTGSPPLLASVGPAVFWRLRPGAAPTASGRLAGISATAFGVEGR